MARAKTFGCMLHGRESRIVRADSNLDGTSPEDVLPIRKRSHHLPLMVSFPLQMSSASHSGTVPPQEDTETIERVNPKAFCRPLDPGQKQMLRCHLEGIMMNDIVRVADNNTAAYAEFNKEFIS